MCNKKSQKRRLSCKETKESYEGKSETRARKEQRRSQRGGQEDDCYDAITRTRRKELWFSEEMRREGRRAPPRGRKEGNSSTGVQDSVFLLIRSQSRLHRKKDSMATRRRVKYKSRHEYRRLGRQHKGRDPPQKETRNDGAGQTRKSDEKKHGCAEERTTNRTESKVNHETKESKQQSFTLRTCACVFSQTPADDSFCRKESARLL